MKTQLRMTAAISLLASLFAIAPRAAELQPIRWVVAEGEQVDKEQALLVYQEACAWLDEHISTSRAPVQPKLVIHIGESCPEDEFAEACFSPATAELYIRRWEDRSVAAVANATLIAGLLQLRDRDLLRRTLASLEKKTSSEPASN